MQLTETLSTNLGLKLTASMIFENPRLGGFVDFIRKELHKGESADEKAEVQHTENVVFAEEHGLGLLLDIFSPDETPNGFAILDVASSKFKSPKAAINHRRVKGIYTGFCSKGFTVFAVRPGNAGNVTVSDMCNHIRLAVRWIVNHAAQYAIDPHNVGLFGLSAGGHLALLTALTSSIEACFLGGVVAFAPPTNLQCSTAEELEVLFCVRRGQELTEEDIKGHSPLWVVDTLPPQQRVPAVLVFHAEQDNETAYEHSENFVDKLKKRGSSAEIIARDSDQHEWPDMHKDAELAAQWMLECLRTRKSLVPSASNESAVSAAVSSTSTVGSKFIRRNRGHCAVGGTWAVYELAHVSQTLEDGNLALPETVKVLEEYALEGTCPRSLDCRCNLLMAVSMAWALESLRSKGFTSEEVVDKALSHVTTELEISKKTTYPYRHVRVGVLHHGMLSKMVALFLNTPLVSRLTSKQHKYMESLLLAAQMPPEEVLQKMLAREDTLLCEFLSEEQLQLDSVKQYVHSMWPASVPGQTTAFLSKYYMATKDVFALNILKELAQHPKTGWIPHVTLPALTFALYFLATSNFPIREFMADEVSQFEEGTKDGLGLFGYKSTHPELDADITALVNIVRVKLGLPMALPSSQFDQFWNETEQCIIAGGMIYYIPEHITHVLEAVLEANDMSREDKLAWWKRTIGALRNIEKTYGAAHDSILYSWWSVIRVFSKFSKEFPEAPTDLHHKALDLLLDCQTSSGGFCYAPFKEANVAETAFGLLAMKSALRSEDPYMMLVKSHLEVAIAKGEKFIQEHWDEDTAIDGEAWLGLLPMGSDIMSSAAVVASLY
mmetsp:Transcript_17076/g.23753  ORF Transcript_17076/g.23753 Transcript_17076/m.23753 type:complete len:834 (-) Transcript_17076:103-2604(-)